MTDSYFFRPLSLVKELLGALLLLLLSLMGEIEIEVFAGRKSWEVF